MSDRRGRKGAQAMTRKLAILVAAFAVLACAQPAFAQKPAAVHRVGFSLSDPPKCSSHGWPVSGKG